MRKGPAFLTKRRAFSRAEPFRVLILRSDFLGVWGAFFKKKSPPKKEPLLRLLIDIDLTVFAFKLTDAVARQKEDLPADGAPIILCDVAELRVGNRVDMKPKMLALFQVLTTKTDFVLIMS